jgi:uncharacterized transporter YbjL
MPMRVAMRTAGLRLIIMMVLMMLIVGMLVLMFHDFMGMPVHMMLRQMQPHAERH